MENSIKNEQSSIEEAIKTMEHWIEYEKNNKEKINKADELINIQETILSDYKRVLKENEQLRTEVNSLKKENELAKEEYDRDTHILQNQLDLANADRIDLAQQNKELRKENKELKENYVCAQANANQVFDILKNYIPKQKVEDKIEYLKDYIEENSDEQGYWGNINPDVIYEQIEILEEILKGSEE